MGPFAACKPVVPNRPGYPEIFRKFLEEDDGSDFVMQNLVKFHGSKIPHPITGEPTDPRAVLDGYFGPFSSALFKRAGHPVVVSQKVGGYIDSWETSADPGWNVVSLMRYRSRRDLAELVVAPTLVQGQGARLQSGEASEHSSTRMP